MEKITRRLFLRNTAAAGAVGATVVTPAAAELAAPLTARERFDAALEQLKAAAEEMDPKIERWDASVAADDGLGCGLVIAAFRRTGQYEGDGTYEGGTRNIWGKYSHYEVRLRDKRIDGHRTFEVKNSMDRMVLTEPRLNTFIGRKVA